MARVLVVANQTLGGSELLQSVQDRISQGPCSFTLLVPATAHARREGTFESIGRRGSGAPSDEDAGGAVAADYEYARRQLAVAIGRLRKLGAEVDGEIGDPNPIKAIEDTLARRGCDEIILSTLPSGASRWLRQDLPHKVIRKFNLPVNVVTASRP